MARLPEGALMQRAAHGLAHAVLDLLGSAYGRRVLLLVGSGDNGGDALYAGARAGPARVRGRGVAARRTHAHAAGWRRCGGPAAGVVDAGAARRRDVVVDGIVGIGGRPGLRPEAAAALDARRGRAAWSRSTPRAGSTSTPASSTGPTSTADAHGHLRHPQGRPPRRPGRRGLRRRAPGRHRPRPARPPRSRRCSPPTWRRCCRARPATRRSTPAAWSASAPAPRSTPAPRCSAWPARLRAGRHGAVRRRRRGRRPGPRASTPRWSAPAGSRPGWSAPAAASGAGTRCARRWPTASRWSSTPTRCTHVDGPLARARPC